MDSAHRLMDLLGERSDGRRLRSNGPSVKDLAQSRPEVVNWRPGKSIVSSIPTFTDLVALLKLTNPDYHAAHVGREFEQAVHVVLSGNRLNDTQRQAFGQVTTDACRLLIDAGLRFVKKEVPIKYREGSKTHHGRVDVVAFDKATGRVVVIEIKISVHPRRESFWVHQARIYAEAIHQMARLAYVPKSYILFADISTGRVTLMEATMAKPMLVTLSNGAILALNEGDVDFSAAKANAVVQITKPDALEALLLPLCSPVSIGPCVEVDHRQVFSEPFVATLLSGESHVCLLGIVVSVYKKRITPEPETIQRKQVTFENNRLWRVKLQRASEVYKDGMGIADHSMEFTSRLFKAVKELNEGTIKLWDKDDLVAKGFSATDLEMINQKPYFQV